MFSAINLLRNILWPSPQELDPPSGPRLLPAPPSPGFTAPPPRRRAQPPPKRPRYDDYEVTLVEGSISPADDRVTPTHGRGSSSGSLVARSEHTSAFMDQTEASIDHEAEPATYVRAPVFDGDDSTQSRTDSGVFLNDYRVLPTSYRVTAVSHAPTFTASPQFPIQRFVSPTTHETAPAHAPSITYETIFSRHRSTSIPTSTLPPTDHRTSPTATTPKTPPTLASTAYAEDFAMQKPISTNQKTPSPSYRTVTPTDVTAITIPCLPLALALPVEIVDLILDYLESDEMSLLKCGKIFVTWRPQLRDRLHRTVSLLDKHSKWLATSNISLMVKRNAGTLPFARCLEVNIKAVQSQLHWSRANWPGRSRGTTAIRAILEHAPNLHTVSLRITSMYERDILREVLELFTTCTITTLNLVFEAAADRYDLAFVLFHFPRLHILRLSPSSRYGDLESTLNVRDAPASLRSLTLTNFHASRFVRYFCHAPTAAHLTSLNLRFTATFDKDGLALWSELLTAVGPTLQSLHICGTPRQDSSIDLEEGPWKDVDVSKDFLSASSLTALTSYSVSADSVTFVLVVVYFLYHLSSPHLRSLRASCEFLKQQTPGKDLVTDFWPMIDRLLADRERWPVLESVWLGLAHDEQNAMAGGMEQSMRKLLEKTAERGVLTVCDRVIRESETQPDWYDLESDSDSDLDVFIEL